MDLDLLTVLCAAHVEYRPGITSTTCLGQKQRRRLPTLVTSEARQEARMPCSWGELHLHTVVGGAAVVPRVSLSCR